MLVNNCAKAGQLLKNKKTESLEITKKKMIDQQAQAKKLTKILCMELFKALGFPRDGLISRALSPLAQKPIHQFSKIAAGFDQRVENLGFQSASRWILPNFIKGMNVTGLENIPREGALVVASNHPGAYDALVITANLPRDDIKIIVNIPLDFISELPSTHPHFLYAPPDPHVRMIVVRSALQHLKSGGALLLFASGGIDPDPASMPGGEERFSKWSRSLEIFLKRVPEAQLLITIVSGILTPKYVHHVFTHFRKERPDKQRVSEFFQVMRQMLSPEKFCQKPKVSFAQPLKASKLLDVNNPTNFLKSVTAQALRQYNFHTQKETEQAFMFDTLSS
jgi:hypothetical protein